MVVCVGEDGPGITCFAAGSFGGRDVLNMEDGSLNMVNLGALGKETNGDSDCIVLLGKRVVFSWVRQKKGTMKVSGKEGIGGKRGRRDAIDAIARVRESFVDCRGYSAKSGGKRHDGFALGRSCGSSVL